MTENVLSQIVGSEQLQFKNYKFYDKLPDYLLSRKSVVFVKVPRDQNHPKQLEDWKKLSNTLHSAFKLMKIDAVGYYKVEDIFSGSDPVEVYAKQLTKREIKYVIYVEKMIDTNESPSTIYFKIIVTPFSGDSQYIAETSNAWKIEGTDLNQILIQMQKDVIRAEMNLENYLISDIPEFFSDVEIITGRRFEMYTSDLKVDKLIVPKFQKIVFKDSTKVDEAFMKRIRAYNSEVDRKNVRLAEIMKNYAPLKYELSDNFTDGDVYNKGGQYVLIKLETSGSTIKELLNYPIDNKETVYASVKAVDIGTTILTLPADAIVHKYYVKHVFTKDVYVGTQWDADLTWEEALTNYIFNMKKTLKIR